MKTWRSASLAVTAVAVMALTSACGEETAGQISTGTPAGNAAAAQPGAAAGYGGGDYGYSGSDAGGDTQAKAGGQLAIWESKELGDVLTDSEGFTLYRFEKDTSKPAKSNCTGDCEKAWPVVLADGAEAPPGVDSSLIGSVARADGTKQLTVDGWPMYRYAQDTKPGDAKGQGVGGTWYAAAPNGKKASPDNTGGAGDNTGGAGDETGGAGKGAEVAEKAGLSVRNDPKLGEIVVDKNGMTVYRFEKDDDWPMKTACTGECLKKWPVVEPVDPEDTEGIVNTVRGKRGFVVFNRPDGLKQQTIECWPIYTFAGDEKPGDTNGQGVGGTWYAISPDGKPVGKE
jgi:predicted lipoprotein with Yx(FWY)xxD motif